MGVVRKESKSKKREASGRVPVSFKLLFERTPVAKRNRALAGELKHRGEKTGNTIIV